MSSIKKVLCIKAKNNHDRTFITNKIYDVEIDGGCGWVKDENGYSTCILFVTPCIYGEWQPLEEYMCITSMLKPQVNLGDVFFAYEKNGTLHCPINNLVISSNNGRFNKVSEMNSAPRPRHEVRHVIYDTKDNKIVNDAMGECYITLSEAQEVCDEMNAPKVMKTKHTKEVEYFGMKVFVPDNAKWLSTTMYGTVFAHCSKTAPSESVCFYGGSDDYVVMGGVDLNGIDWKDTLVDIK